MKKGMNIAFFGSSLVSAYWNGAATYYRGIIRALHQRGHRVTFYEPDAYDRQKHREERKRCGHDRETDLFSSFDRGLERRHSFFLNKAKDVFEHHDRVIHDDTDHQRQREHPDVLKRETHRGHQAKRGDD